MDATTLAERKKKHMLITMSIMLVVFAVAWLTLPVISEKVLVGVVLVLIAGMLYLTNDTGRYVCKRVLLALLTIFIIAAITFFAMNAIPGGPFSSEKAPSEAVKAVLEKRFHLDKPVGEQFLLYLDGQRTPL